MFQDQTNPALLQPKLKQAVGLVDFSQYNVLKTNTNIITLNLQTPLYELTESP